jgi:hypothetical protein
VAARRSSVIATGSVTITTPPADTAARALVMCAAARAW